MHQVDRPRHERTDVPGPRVVLDKLSLLPEVEVVDGVVTLTDRGRYQAAVTLLLYVIC